MGQQEVYELLKNKRLSGDDRYFSVKEVRIMVMDSHSATNSLENVSRSLERLWFWGLIEKKDYKFRLNKKALEQSNL